MLSLPHSAVPTQLLLCCCARKEEMGSVGSHTGLRKDRKKGDRYPAVLKSSNIPRKLQVLSLQIAPTTVHPRKCSVEKEQKEPTHKVTK